MSTARSSIWSRTGSRMRGTPRLSSLTLGFDWSGSSLNSSSPAITASCDSMIEENHIRRVVRYTHAKDSQPLRREPGPWPGEPRRMAGTNLPSRSDSLAMGAFVYILLCADRSYYVGSGTGDDLAPRISQ